MFANKSILLSFLVWGLVATSCASESTPTAQFGPTVTPIQREPTSTVFIGIPPISNPIVQAEGESVEEFVVRIATTKIISGRPFLIALSQMESKENLWQGVSPEVKVMEKCWIYEIDASRQCTNEDIQNNIGNQKAPKIFFAFAYSNSTQELFVLDYYRPWIEDDGIDGYRLVIELKDGVWGEKSLTQVY